MPNTCILRNRRGATLIELIVALFISSVVVAGVYQLYNFVTISTTREKQKAELQRDIITVSNMIERDIRGAGCNLPGNGVTSLLDNTGGDRLSMYANENRRATTLALQAIAADSIIRIADTAGFIVDGFVCFAAPVDTIYKKIQRIGVNNSGSDTLYLYSKLGAGTFTTAATGVFPAIRISYQFTGSPVAKLYRVRNAISAPISSLLDSIKIIPKNAAGTVLGSASDQAAVITVLMGGHVGKNGNRVFIGDSTEINIRNGT